MGSCQSQCNSFTNNQIVEEEVQYGKNQAIPIDGQSPEAKDLKKKSLGNNVNTQQQSTQNTSASNFNGKINISQSKTQNSTKKEQNYESANGPVNPLNNSKGSEMRGNEIKWKNIKQRAVLNIFYGTTQGTTSELATQFASECEQNGFYVRVIHIQTFEPKMLRNCNLVVFFLASYGIMGGPTDDAQQFYLWLNNFDNQGKPLSSLNYSIFGLYNSKIKRLTVQTNANNDTEIDSTNNIEPSSYINNNMNHQKQENEEIEANMNQSVRFQKAMNKKQTKIKSMGQRIDMLLQEVGAKRFYNLIQVDSSKEELLKESFNQFKNGMIGLLTSKFEFQEKPEDAIYNEALLYNLNIYICSIDKYPKGANNRKELEQMFNIKNVQSRGQYVLKDELWDYFNSTDIPISKMQYLVCDGIKDTITVHSYTQQSQSNVIAHASRQGINSKLFNQQHQYMLIDLDVSKLPSPPGKPKFETGGLIQIYPQNDDASVKRLCEFLGLNENAVISLSIKEQSYNPCNITVSELKYPIPFPITVKQYMKEYLDIHGKLDRNQVFELANFASDQVDKETLNHICKFSERERFDKEIYEQEQHSLLSLIINYNIKVPFHILFGLGNLIKPRTFVISSSFLQNPNIIQLTVRIHLRNIPKLNDEITENFQASSNRFRKSEGQEEEIAKTRNISLARVSNPMETRSLGLISNYFLDLYSEIQKQKPQEVRIKSSPNPFQLPLNEINIRVVLICIDEGIGFFRSYLQEIRQVNNCHNHEIYLYYGSRLLQNNEYLYQNEIQEFEKEGILKKLEVALTTSNSNMEFTSRDNKSEKIQLESVSISNISTKNNTSSIQLLLESQMDQFSQLIEHIDEKESNVRIYISGSQLMSQGILGAIAKSYCQIKKVSQYAAFNSVLNHENDGKIVRIIWES
ncbi:hypothetical protein ABPG72_001615 [Tetrahymena utriculariae]